MRMKIAHQIFFGFLFILLLFSLTTWINYKQSEAVKDNTEYLGLSTTVVRQGNRFQRNLIVIVSSLRAYFLTADTSFIQTYEGAAQENINILDELRHDADPKQQDALSVIARLHQNWQREFSHIVNDVRKTAINSRDAVDLSSIYKNQFPIIAKGDLAEDLQLELRRFINDEYRRREQRKKELGKTISQTRRISVFLTVFSILSGFVISAWVAKRISNRVLRLVKMSDAIAEGQYKVQVDPGDDELGRLAGSLNHMARTLDSNISELTRKNRELDQFAHIVSHDLKSPLRGISNIISWIEEDHGQEISIKLRDYIELIKGRLSRASQLIEGILLYARVGREPQPLENVAVLELVEEIVANQSLQPGTQIEIAPGLPTIYTERLPLFQVFSNLVSNAVKYNNSQHPALLIWHVSHTDEAEFFIADNGPGIAPAYHEKIFQIFQTLDQAEGGDSTGVGLAIVKKILDARRERIKLISDAGAGTTISFTWKINNAWTK
jgi:signal transduction histidine kinase